MLALLISSTLNGPFKMGHAKVRDSEINHTDGSFPLLNLWPC